MEHFYYGPVDRRLFGCYHPPASGRSQGCGVVLCYPMGHEYILFHRTFRQLALRLAREGFPVLRFDYYGCGDSGGDWEAGTLRQWLADISLAIAETKDRSRVSRISLLGLRLGGTLALMVGAGRRDVESMVLWDPVYDGTAYLEELKALQSEMIRDSHVVRRRDETGEAPDERLGFALSSSLQSEIAEISLRTMRDKPAERILIIESHPSIGQAPLVASLRGLKADVDSISTPNRALWRWEEDMGRVLMPQQIVESIVAWVARAHT